MQRLSRLNMAMSSQAQKQFKQVQNLVKTKIELVKRSTINHDSFIYSFKFVGDTLPLTIGKHFIIKQFLKTWEFPEGQQIKKKYTPLTHKFTNNGLMDVLFKIYRPNVHSKFPNGGKLTTFIQNMKVGEQLNVQGPLGRFNYRRGIIKLEGEEEFPVKKIVMMAGGSGITPMFNVINDIVQDKQDKTQIVLLYTNRSEEDILLRKQLEALSSRVRLHYMIDVGTPEWKGFIGYIRKEVLQKITGLEQPQTFYCFSGPFFMNQTIRKIFEEFPKAKLFKF